MTKENDEVVTMIMQVLYSHNLFAIVALAYMSLGTTNITNNTEILITDIGEDAPDGLPSLTCRTDLRNCCRNSDTVGQGALGEWYYPNGSIIPFMDTTSEGFYRRRNFQTVIMIRSETVNPLSPTGSYCCEIPTTRGNRTLCANIGALLLVYFLCTM